MLLIPCSAGKRDNADLGLVPAPISSFLGDRANALFREGRAQAFERTSLDGSSLPTPALTRYSGQPYKTPGFVEAVLDAMARGLHVLVVSGGYGLVRAEEPIPGLRSPDDEDARGVAAEDPADPSRLRRAQREPSNVRRLFHSVLGCSARPADGGGLGGGTNPG